MGFVQIQTMTTLAATDYGQVAPLLFYAMAALIVISAWAIVLSDEAFAQGGVERRNKARVTTERVAHSRRAQQPERNYTVDRSTRTFPKNAPRLGGGGALDPATVAGMFAVLLVGARAVRRKK